MSSDMDSQSIDQQEQINRDDLKNNPQSSKKFEEGSESPSKLQHPDVVHGSDPRSRDQAIISPTVAETNVGQVSHEQEQKMHQEAEADAKD